MDTSGGLASNSTGGLIDDSKMSELGEFSVSVEVNQNDISNKVRLLCYTLYCYHYHNSHEISWL